MTTVELRLKDYQPEVRQLDWSKTTELVIDVKLRHQ